MFVFIVMKGVFYMVTIYEHKLFLHDILRDGWIKKKTITKTLQIIISFRWRLIYINFFSKHKTTVLYRYWIQYINCKKISLLMIPTVLFRVQILKLLGLSWIYNSTGTFVHKLRADKEISWNTHYKFCRLNIRKNVFKPRIAFLIFWTVHLHMSLLLFLHFPID